MTLESFARRLGGAFAFSGLGVWVAAVVCWASVGDAGPVVHSIHTVAGWGLAVFGTVLIVIGLTITSGVPPEIPQDGRSVDVSDGVT
jgi:hypothetical protein